MISVIYAKVGSDSLTQIVQHELDELRSHNHDIVYYTQNGSEGLYEAMDKRRTASANKRYDVSSKARGGSETRPLNIAMIQTIYLGIYSILKFVLKMN